MEFLRQNCTFEKSQVKEKLARLLDDGKYRYDLFRKMKSVEFTNSKKSIDFERTDRPIRGLA